MKEIEVVAGIILFENKILCTQRNKGKNNEVDFKWEFAGGKVENGETHQQALKRELLEELNLEVDVGEYFSTLSDQKDDLILNLHFYYCYSKTNTVELNVHTDYKWLEKSNLKTLDWAKLDAVVVDKLLE